MSKNFPKFKYGDKVEVEYGAKGVVKSVMKKDGKFITKVLLDSGFTFEYNEDSLKFDTEFLEPKKEVHIGTICPVCQTKYKITRFGAKEWKDCVKCKKTAEQLCQEAANPNDDGQLDFASFDADDWTEWLK